jgi:DNA-binding transcriptional regulator YiaG
MTKTRSHDDKSQWLETIWKALRSHRENSARIGVSEHDQEWLGICKAMALVTEELGLKQMPADDYLSLNQGLEEDVGHIDVKAWRKARKITQEQAADILGVGARHIQRLESGDRRLTPTLVKLMGQL